MCMNRTTQAGHYEGFGQSQNHKPVEPGSTAFEENPAPTNEPELFPSSIPETSMSPTCILKLTETVTCILDVFVQWKVITLL